MIIGLTLIVIFFSLKADNFFTPGNFTNIITQMAGVTMLAYGVVFVLLIGEIDLSISYVSGIAGVVVAQLTLAGSSHQIPGLLAIFAAVAVCALIGAFQGSIVALIGVPAFVVTLAGYQIWQGVIQKSIPQGVLVIQDNTVNNMANYFFSKQAGWIIAFVVSGFYVDQHRSAACWRAAGTASRSAIQPSSPSSWSVSLRSHSASSRSATGTAACPSCCS